MIKLNATKLKEMFFAGGEAIKKEKEYIDELNVFPVPDGDTGTNLSITIDGALNSIANVQYNDIQLLGKQFSRGLLMNARGNSGVIFSQIFKGFVSNFEVGENEISLVDLIKCFKNASTCAYAAVASPIEGTILTVIRVTSEKLEANHKKIHDIETLFKLASQFAKETLLETPNMLRELKEVGVVDSGGYGLHRFIEAMYLNLIKNSKSIPIHVAKPEKVVARKSIISSLDDKNVGFGYCTEAIIMLMERVALSQPQKYKFDLKYFKKKLNKMGDSLAVVKDGSIVKIHIHTLRPYDILEFCAKYGEFHHVKIENMTQQFLERNPGTTLETIQDVVIENKKLSAIPAVVATVPSSRLVETYESVFNIKNTINTGLTGNPSIQNFIDTINATQTSNVIVLVDDSNVVLAANEAAELLKKSVNIEVVNAKNIVCSYLAALSFDPEKDIKSNVKIMESVIDRCRVGKISIASKNVNYSHLLVKKGEYIGIVDKTIICADKDINKVIVNICSNVCKNAEQATIIFGNDAKVNENKFIRKHLLEKYSVKSHFIPGEIDIFIFYIGATK